MADPISASIAAVVTFVGGTAAAVTGFIAAPLVGLLGEGAAIALAGAALKVTALAVGSAALSAVMAPKTGKGGSPTAFKADPNAPVRGVMGRFGTGGTQLHFRVWGKENVFISYMTALSLGPIAAIAGFSANTFPIAFNPATGKSMSQPYLDNMWQTQKLGRAADGALLPPSGLNGGHVNQMSEWTTAHKASGLAAGFWTMRTDSKRAGYPNGVPMPQWTVNGMLMWQPRFDSTYPGGSGPQRRDDWRTWGYSENPYDHALAWVRGHFKLNADGTIDRTKRIAGIGAPDRGIDIAAFVEGANIADANGWKIAGEWTTADDKWSTLAAMLQAGGGVPLNRGAQISVMVNTPRVSLLTYTSADRVGPVSMKVMTSRRDRRNTIIPSYRAESQKFERVTADPVTAQVYVDEDRGETRSREVFYEFVTSPKQAAELAAYDLTNSREGLSAGLPSKPYLLGLKAGDAFTINDPELGLNGQKVLVTKRNVEVSSGIVTLEIQSETDAKHPYALGQTANPPPTPSLTAIDDQFVSPPNPEDFIVIPRMPGEDGVQVPIIDIEGGVSNATATAVLVEWGYPPDPPAPDPLPTAPPGQRQPVFADYVNWHSAGTWPVTATGITLNGIQPGATYYVAFSYVRGQNVSERSVKGPEIAPGLIAGGLSPESPTWDAIRQIASDAGEGGSEAIADAEARMAQALATAKGQLEAADAQLADADALAASNLLAADTRLTNALNSKAPNTTVTALQTQANGLSAWRITAEQTLADLPNQYASASSVTGLQSEVVAARDGQPNLRARLIADRQTVTDGLAQKASATDFANLLSEVTGARNGSPSLSAQLTTMRQTLVDGLSGKVGVSDLAALSATVTSQGSTITAQNTRLNTVEADLANKATSSSVTALQSSVAVRNRQFRQETAPTSPAGGYPLIVNDRWINTTAGQNNAESAWSGTAWISITDPRIASSATGITDLTAKIGNVSGTVADALTGKANANEVASMAATVASQGTTISAQNTRLNTVESDLLSKAASTALLALQSVVERKVTVRLATTPPTVTPGYTAGLGDLWFNTADNNRTWSYNGTSWIEVTDPRVAAALLATANLEAKIGTFTGTVADAVNNKANATDLVNLTTRVTSAEGVNTAQNNRLNTAESDILSKASAGSVQTLSAEVASARNGSPSLSAQLSSMRQVVVDGLAQKASTIDVTTLFSRMGAAESSIIAAASTAASADGKASALWGVTFDVNGYASGFTSSNNGSKSAFEVAADLFAIRATGTAARTEFTGGIWYAYDATNTVRSSWGRPHGASGHGLTWWTGPNSVAKGSETKNNAYVYISMNAVGGPRFGGSDVPTGGSTTIEGPVVRGQTRSFNSGDLTNTATWVSAGSVTLTEVPAGANLSFQLLNLTGTSGGGISGSSFSGEARILDGGSVVTTTSFLLYEEVAGSQRLEIDGGFATANVTGSGTKTYAVELRRTGPASLTFPSGQWSIVATTLATVTQAGMMSPQQVQQLTDLAAGGGGGSGPPLATTTPASLAATGVVGVSTSAARADHVHAHGSQGGGLSHTIATATDNGFMSNTMFVKLTGIATGADNVGQNPAFTTLRLTGNEDASPTSLNHPLQVGPTSGTNVRIDGNEVMAVDNGVASPLYLNQDGGPVYINGVVAYHAGNYTSIPLVTTALAGLMSAADKSTLNGLAAGGGGVTLATTAPQPIAGSNVVGVGATAARADHVHAHGVQGGGTAHAAATSSAAGFMPAADKAKLDAATAGNTANAIVMRDASGRISSEMFSSGGTASAGYFIASRQMSASGSGFGFNVACTGPAFTPTSDLRLKINFTFVGDEAARERLMQVEPLEYTRIQDGIRARGFGAQGLREIDPLYVTGDEPIFDQVVGDDGEPVLDGDGKPEMAPRLDENGEQSRTYLGVDPMAIIADLVATARVHEVAIGALELRHQQALNRIEALEAQIAA